MVMSMLTFHVTNMLLHMTTALALQSGLVFVGTSVMDAVMTMLVKAVMNAVAFILHTAAVLTGALVLALHMTAVLALFGLVVNFLGVGALFGMAHEVFFSLINPTGRAVLMVMLFVVFHNLSPVTPA